MNKDVFETFYLKRASKSSHSSKSSNDSFRGADDTSPTHNKPYSYGANDGSKERTKHTPPTKYQSFNGKSSTITIKSPQPRQYLFGSMQRKAPKHEPEKENIYDDSSNQVKDADRYKTVTINSIRRSFRDTFLKPAKGREHQQLWFIDVNDEKASSQQQQQQQQPHTESNEPSRKGGNSNSSIVMQRQPNGIDDDAKYGHRTNASVKRNETFRIDNNSKGNESRSNGRSVSRHDTFRIQRNGSPVMQRERLKTPSIEPSPSRHQSTLERNMHNDSLAKKIPIAVTAPYSALNDNQDNYSDSFESQRPHNKYGTYVKKPKNHYADKQPSSDDYQSNRNYSPVHYSSEYDHRPTTLNKSSIEIRSPEERPPKYRYDLDGSDPFDHRTIIERQSFRSDTNDSTNRPRAHRSFASLRSKLERAATSNRNYSNKAPDYDDLDGFPDHTSIRDTTFPKSEPWKRISTRQFSNDTDTENRSFVPYRQTYDRYDTHDNYDKYDKYNNHSEPEPTTKSNNFNNRTKININYNYNAPSHKTNATGNLSSPTPKSPKKPTGLPVPAGISKSTSAIKSSTAKDKPNKNRSVNFPSVECEVRLISPNYDTKPRRKESWKSKPSNDWTFNKVHL